MIITVTLNPSVDYLYTIESFKLGYQNRFSNPTRMVGGKGINAARTASILGSRVLATGVLSGENGNLVRKLTQHETFNNEFYELPDGETRNAITIMHDGGLQTEIVEEGPLVNSDVEELILNKIIDICEKEANINVICLSGSVNSNNLNLYRQYIEKITKKYNGRIKVLVDISRAQLKNVLHSDVKPYFIKPNIYEFSEIIGEECYTKEEVIRHLEQAKIFEGIELVLVSCGSEGALAKYDGIIYDLEIPSINLVNPTGSGDATVGGVAYALDNGMDFEEVLKYAMACGVANAMEKAVGFVRKNNVSSIMNEIAIKKVFPQEVGGRM